MSEKIIEICKFNAELNVLLETDFPAFPIFKSKGLYSHLVNRKHFVALKYFDLLPEIITFPHYIGFSDDSLKVVRSYDDHIYAVIKRDKNHNHWYVATMFNIKESKLNSYLQSGRLKKVDIDLLAEKC